MGDGGGDSGGGGGGGGDEVSKLIDHLFLCKLLFCYKLRQWNCIAPIYYSMNLSIQIHLRRRNFEFSSNDRYSKV